MLAEQHGEWTEGRRFLGLDLLANSQAITIVDIDAQPPTHQEATTDPLTPALTA